MSNVYIGGRHVLLHHVESVFYDKEKAKVVVSVSGRDHYSRDTYDEDEGLRVVSSLLNRVHEYLLEIKGGVK